LSKTQRTTPASWVNRLMVGVHLVKRTTSACPGVPGAGRHTQ
jgi:hypothetical protein